MSTAPIEENRTAGVEQIRWPELRKIVPLSRVSIWRLERSGKFPARIKIGDRAVAWRLTAVLEWLETRREQSRTTN